MEGTTSPYATAIRYGGSSWVNAYYPDAVIVLEIRSVRIHERSGRQMNRLLIVGPPCDGSRSQTFDTPLSRDELAEAVAEGLERDFPSSAALEESWQSILRGVVEAMEAGNALLKNRILERALRSRV